MSKVEAAKTHPGREVKDDAAEDDDLKCADVFGANDEKEENGKDDQDSDSDYEVDADLKEAENKSRQANTAMLEEQEAKAQEIGLSKEERYKKVMELLSKSEFYSNYLKKDLDKGYMESLEAAKQRLKEEAKEKEKEKAKTRKRKSSLDSDEKKPEEKKAVKYGPNGEVLSEDQPMLLSGGVMRDYQIKGYLWMCNLYLYGINGILADEMGLGKTIQTIALFCHLMEQEASAPFLIVAPLSTVKNWKKEFSRFAPLVPAVVYHGDQKERAVLRARYLKKATKVDGLKKPLPHVFITSYEIAINDRTHFGGTRFTYLVVDEGHRLKNRNCKLIKELKQYQSGNRMLLTGTPLQNDLNELWSLLNFLMPEIFDDLRVFESWFDAKEMDNNSDEAERIIKQERQTNILSTLHRILTPFLLRRVKADVDLKIPPKKEVLVYCPLSPRQKEMYTAVVTKTITNLMDKENKEEKEEEANLGRSKRNKLSFNYSVFLREDGQGEKEYERYEAQVAKIQEAREEKKQELEKKQRKSKNVNRSRVDAEVHVSLKSRLMDLRKVTNHPYLLEYPLVDDPEEEGKKYFKADQDLIDICGKMQVLDQMLEELLSRQHKVLIFSQMTRMLDILGDYLGQVKNLEFSRLDGTMGLEERQDNIDAFNETDECRIFLLSTRAGGLGINLTAADTCIIYDSDWNPQQDLQAQDRCHRIGQTNPVMVYRLVTAKTIDQRIVERAAAKRKLEKMIIHSKKFKSNDSAGLKKTMEAVTPAELLELLNSEDATGVVDRSEEAGTPGKSVLSKQELELLLDRSDLTWQKQKSELPAKKKPKLSKNGIDGRVFTVLEDLGPEGLPSIK